MDFISALKSVQIRSLVNSGDLQLSLFDEVNLAEISSPLFPGERLVVCRNPAVAGRARPQTRRTVGRDRSRARQGQGERRTAPAAGCAPPTPVRSASAPARSQQVQGRQALHPADHRRRLRLRAQDRADQQRGRPRRPLRDPHHPPRTRRSARRAAVRAYKQLKMAERAFGTMKDTIEIRPIHHHLETRVRAHVFLCMLAYYVSFELQAAPPRAAVHRRNPARPNRPRQARHPLPPPPTRRPAAPPPRRVPRPHPPRPPRRPRHHLPQHRSASAPAEHTFTRLTTPTPLQAHALELLDVKLHE